jgi:hypothetical protein
VGRRGAWGGAARGAGRGGEGASGLCRRDRADPAGMRHGRVVGGHARRVAEVWRVRAHARGGGSARGREGFDLRDVESSRLDGSDARHVLWVDEETLHTAGETDVGCNLRDVDAGLGGGC